MGNKKEAKPENEKILNLLHMARKAGVVKLGFDASQRSCFQGKAKLILTAGDLSARQKQNIQSMADAYNVKFVEFASKQILGVSLNLRDVGILCIEDRNFASGIIKQFNK